MNIYRRNKLLKDFKKFIHYRRIYYNHRLEDFPLSYKPNEIDQKRYELWEKNNYFNPSTKSEKIFSMILPPPNVTGTLHLGHTLTATIQDILARWYRMRGTPVIWVPGFDHAGIATQAVLEKHLIKTKGIRRSEISKEEFMPFLWQWKEEKCSVIREQLKQLGVTLDWSKEYFTMSDTHNSAVLEALMQLNDKGLLFRDKSLINWSPSLCSALSDVEVEYKEITEKTNLELPGYKRKIPFGEIFEIVYNVHNSDEKITVATTRPETIFGDVALAVHPNDDRYSRFIGQLVENPITNRLMPIVADEGVKINFGTGVVKITPAHDHFDYSVAKKHNLEFINVIDEHGKMTSSCGSYAGLPRYFARHKVLEELSAKSHLKSVKNHPTLIPLCSRTGDVIEYLLREQWFIKCKSMAKNAIDAVKSGQLKLNSEVYERIWFEWLDNVRDWCVSRQIWWGHQIPAYKCTFKSGSSEWIIARSENEARQICLDKYAEDPCIEQDMDVLDTWFSSSLLPFTAMGWPNNKTPEFDKLYPLSLMETGHDILFFWVARMVMLGIELTGKLPFNELFLHGILCDGRGKKMSKSSGNVILPENVINGITFEDLNNQAKKSFEDGILSEKDLKQTLSVNAKVYPNGIPECGVDALRFTLISHNVKEQTVSFNETECKVNKFFGNKIWQASRYTILMTSDEPIKKPNQLTLIDEWILSRLSLMISTVNSNLESRTFSKAATAIKDFLYYEFCDFYVEGTKLGFKTEQSDIIDAHRCTLAHCLEVSLRILSPFMPYFADELYGRLSDKLSLFHKYDSLAQASYPLPKEFDKYRNNELESNMETVLKVIDTIRKLMGNLSKKTDLRVYVVADNNQEKDFINVNRNMICGVAKVSNINIIHATEYKSNENSIWDTAGPNCNVYIEIENAEHLKLIKEKVKKKRTEMEKKLEELLKAKSRPDFSSKSEEEKCKVVKRIESFEQELKKLPQLI